ncbi:10700_t:CDS:2, partial [Gigaspora rosea]
SRPFSKRQIRRYFQGGEGIVIDNNGPELICSAGFSAIDVETLCLPESHRPQEIYHAPWHPPFPEQPGFYHFGRMYYARRSRIDFALIEKLEETYILNAMVRTSIPEYPTLFIDDFDFGTSIPVGHHICKSGYGTGSTCGIINTLNSRLALIRGTDFYHITKVNMETLENDRGGTVFYFTFSDDNAYFMISGYGICSHTYS